MTAVCGMCRSGVTNFVCCIVLLFFVVNLVDTDGLLLFGMSLGEQVGIK